MISVDFGENYRYALLWDSVIVLCFVVRNFVSILVLQLSQWEERAACFVCLPDCCVALPQDATGLSADCGIS